MLTAIWDRFATVCFAAMQIFLFRRAAFAALCPFMHVQSLNKPRVICGALGKGYCSDADQIRIVTNSSQ